jgi:two-component system, sensor histidine kinase and response regulator
MRLAGMSHAPNGQAPFKMKILVIEDDRVAAKLFGNWLAKAGYEVEFAVDGPTGLERIADTKPDAVLLDLLLPGANGWDVLRILRENPGFSNTPVVVYTNGFVQSMVDQAVAAGANQVLNKATLTSQQLSDAFRAALGSGGTQAAA